MITALRCAGVHYIYKTPIPVVLRHGSTAVTRACGTCYQIDAPVAPVAPTDADAVDGSGGLCIKLDQAFLWPYYQSKPECPQLYMWHILSAL